MPFGNEWFWLYWAHKKGAQYSVIKAKPDTRRKEQLIGNISLISAMNIFSVSIQIVEHFDGAVLSHFSPPFFLYWDCSLKMTLQDDEIMWLPKFIGFSLYLSQDASCWIRVNTFGSFLKLFHFLFQHSFLFYWIQHIY